MRKYKCIRGWARNSVGDIVEHYMIKRYPSDVRSNNFVEITDQPKKKKSTSKPKAPTKSTPKPSTVKISEG